MYNLRSYHNEYHSTRFDQPGIHFTSTCSKALTNMKAKFIADLKTDQESVMQFLKSLAGKNIKITMEELLPVSGKELLSQLEETRKSTSAIPVLKVGDINEIIDEINNTYL